MKFRDLQAQSHQYTLQGFLAGFLPLTLLAADVQSSPLPLFLAPVAGVLAMLLHCFGISMIFRLPFLGRCLSLFGVMLETLTLWHNLAANALLALFYAIVSVALIYYLFTTKLHAARVTTAKLRLDRFFGSSWALLWIAALSPLLAYKFETFPYCVLISIGVSINLLNAYLKQKNYFNYRLLIKTLMVPAILIVVAFALLVSSVTAALIIAIPALIFAFRQKHTNLEYLQLVVEHPARFLFLTFLMLGTVGTLLLRTAFAMQGEISVLDAAFTAVSGTCVTGLTVIDISTQLTLAGRLILLLLIQLGGLGIMALTTLALHALGKLSLNQEQLAAEMTTGNDRDIFYNLRLILKFTFIVEFIGACFLTWGFYSVHHNFLQALELGIFTSVSAFCNAGFFPGSSNLVPYAGEYLLLIVVALEIILGGIAPAVTWTAMRCRSRRQMPFICKLVICTTGILLFSGTALLLLFEWNGIFSHLSIPGKVVNAFFQSTTLRTAGFNTVPLGNLGMQSFMIMLLMMFIGGSPGGSAGGIKTTTIAVLAFTFGTAMRNEESVTVDQRKISQRNVIQAVSIAIAALLVLFLIVLMLTATQQISAGKLLFEAVSALGTVGLSLDATTALDAVGKVIIMMAMFIGRIGPLTLFLILSDRRPPKQPGYPEIKIPLG